MKVSLFTNILSMTGVIGYGRSSIQMVACPVRDIISVDNCCFRKKRAVRYEMCLIDTSVPTARSKWA